MAFFSLSTIVFIIIKVKGKSLPTALYYFFLLAQCFPIYEWSTVDEKHTSMNRIFGAIYFITNMFFIMDKEEPWLFTVAILTIATYYVGVREHHFDTN